MPCENVIKAVTSFHRERKCATLPHTACTVGRSQCPWSLFVNPPLICDVTIVLLLTTVWKDSSQQEKENYLKGYLFVNLKLLAILQFESLIFLNLKHCISFWSFLPSLLRKCYWNIISVFFLFCFCRRYIFLGLFFFSYLLSEHMNIKSSLSFL